MKPTIITAHDHVTGLGRAVVAAPTKQTLEQVTAWHLSRFWRSLAVTIPQPPHRRMAYVGT